MVRPSPAALRQAADAVEKAVAATEAAKQQEEQARLARAEANTAEVNADEAVKGACGAGCNSQPPQPPQPPVTPPSGNGKGKKNGKGCCCCGIIGIILASLALLLGSVLAFTKASTGSLEEVKKSVEAVMVTAGLAEKKADQALVKAGEALEASKACAQVCNKKPEAKQPTAKKPQMKKPSAPKPAPQAVVPPQAPQSVPQVAPAPLAPAADRLSVSYELCRLRSDGTARLLTDKKTVLTHGYVIAVESQDSSSPFVRISGEDCNAWRARMTTKLVDKTTGGG